MLDKALLVKSRFRFLMTIIDYSLKTCNAVAPALIAGDLDNFNLSILDQLDVQTQT